MSVYWIKDIIRLSGPLFFLIFFFVQPLCASAEVNKMAGIVVWIALWWLSECVPLAVTSLLPLVLIPVSQIAGIREVSKEYGDSIIFLFLGGFLMSIAIEKWNLHKRIVRWIMRFTGRTVYGLLAGMMITSYSISNWISNTATALMLLSVIIAVIKELEDSMPDKDRVLFASALMLGMAYSASIGGMATPVGTPPNMYFFKVYPKLLGTEFHISFAEWMAFFFPLTVFILMGCFFILKILFLQKMTVLKIDRKKDWAQVDERFSYEEKIVGILFFIMVILWLTREGWRFGNYQILGWKFLFKEAEFIDDSVIVLAAAILLFVIPSKQHKGRSILEWADVRQLKYEILLLFGGGFALAYGIEKSGLIQYLVQQLSFVKQIYPLWMILVISVIVVVISEFASNIAAVQIILPVIAAMVVHIPQEYSRALIFSCVLSASVGFMLPVATPPNTIAFGSGYIRVQDMLKTGFWLDLFSIFAISIYGYFVL